MNNETVKIIFDKMKNCYNCANLCIYKNEYDGCVYKNIKVDTVRYNPSVLCKGWELKE